MLPLDLLMALCALMLSTLFQSNAIFNRGDIYIFVLLPLLFPVVFYIMGIYQILNRYLAISGLIAITKAAIYSELILLAVLLAAQKLYLVKFFLLYGLLTFNFCILARVLLAFVYAKIKQRNITNDEPDKNILIYGAGDAGIQLANNFPRHSGIFLKGYLDDNKQLQGRTINEVKIYGPHQIKNLQSEFQISEIYLAIPSASTERYHEIVSWLSGLNIKMRTLPKLQDIPKGRVRFEAIRVVDVEDLLLRPPVKPDETLMVKNIAEKVVLVTGAGGSIGSEICRQISALCPKKLILLDHSEYNLYKISGELDAYLNKNNEHTFEIVPLLASVLDDDALSKIMSLWLPDTVFHAAAYKHVSIVESNLAVGIRNNIWGTLHAATAAYRSGVKNFILISTDKAVRPTSAMGASKRVAELILQAFSDQQFRQSEGHATCFSMVRFGNVLGSSGSVVPLFQEQIKSGGPITVRHRDITRFFMTISEAAQLVIQASSLSQGGDVFLLDMGQSIKIFDLAQKMIELSGLKIKSDDCPDGDIEILVTGLSAGEKLFEEMLINHNPAETVHPRIMRAREVGLPWEELRDGLSHLDEELKSYDAPRIYNSLSLIVAGYSHTALNIDNFSLEKNK